MLIDDGAELVEFGWCGGRSGAPDVIFDVEIPDLRCSIPIERQQGDLPADPDVLRTINAHADHCPGVYANVAKVVLAEGDLLGVRAVRCGLDWRRSVRGHHSAQARSVAGLRRADATRRVTGSAFKAVPMHCC